jgi:hypothetical protein
MYERRTSMKDHSPTVQCGCGTLASQVFNWQGESFVKGNERPFKLDASCVPIGWEHGNTGPRQQERYSKLIAEKKKQARRVDKQAIKGGIRHIASVPRELYRARRNQYGMDYLNPAATTEKELVDQLKADGLYLHKDG